METLKPQSVVNPTEIKHSIQECKEVVNQVYKNRNFLKSMLMKDYFFETKSVKKISLKSGMELDDKGKPKVIGWAVNFQVSCKQLAVEKCNFQLQSTTDKPDTLKIVLLDGGIMTNESLFVSLEDITKCNVPVVNNQFGTAIKNWKDFQAGYTV
ncbi:hypothetical protein ACFL15_01285 [Patescibacteria group bacterium]